MIGYLLTVDINVCSTWETIMMEHQEIELNKPVSKSFNRKMLEQCSIKEAIDLNLDSILSTISYLTKNIIIDLWSSRGIQRLKK